MSDELISNITSAFKGYFKRPSRVTCYSENDPEDYDGEGESVEEFYRGSDWESISFKGAGGFLISYLEADALLYYLPAILIEIVSNKRPSTDFTDRAFTDFGEAQWFDKRMEDVLAKLTTQQKNVLVAAFNEVNSWDGSYYCETKFINEKYGC